jgi:hypothetical protein
MAWDLKLTHLNGMLANKYRKIFYYSNTVKVGARNRGFFKTYRHSKLLTSRAPGHQW